MRLQDVHTAADREAFERWIAEAPAHKRTYDQLMSVYEATGLLRSSAIAQRRDLEAAFARPSKALRFAVAGAAALILVAVIIGNPFRHQPRMALEAVMLSSGDTARNVTLADGSALTMAARSQVEIDLDPNRRFARVRRGRVRLTIMNDSRPFRIVAGNSVLEANKGAFDAQILGAQGSVAPVSRGTGARVRTAAGAPAHGSTPDSFGRIEFNAEPLRFAVERINGVHAGPRLEIDPGLADLRVTGVFQEGRSEALARSLALAFDLKVVEASPGVLLLTR